MKPGRVIYIDGKTPSGGTGMVFNIRQDGNIALHFNPRFEDKCVVRNSFIGGEWGYEEKYGGLPFGTDEPYTAAIICQEHGYQIAINGHFFTNYGHRLPVKEKVIIEVNPQAEIIAK